MEVTVVFWGTSEGAKSIGCHMKSGLEAGPATSSRGLLVTYPWQRA